MFNRRLTKRRAELADTNPYLADSGEEELWRITTRLQGLGGFGWMGRSIDVGSMMTASVGLGIAVDGTVHYLTWFSRGMKSGLSRQASILNAYRHSAPAMLRTTAICGAGLAVYGLSSFLPAARFGWIVCVLLLAALVGDLLLLPAMLAGRLGNGTGNKYRPAHFSEPDFARNSIKSRLFMNSAASHKASPAAMYCSKAVCVVSGEQRS